MPCSDGLSYSTSTEYVDNPKVAAMLCAVLTVLNNNGTLQKTLALAEWEESGVSHDSTMKWWENHRAADARRRAREKAEKLASRQRDEEAYERLKKRLGK